MSRDLGTARSSYLAKMVLRCDVESDFITGSYKDVIKSI